MKDLKYQAWLPEPEVMLQITKLELNGEIRFEGDPIGGIEERVVAVSGYETENLKEWVYKGDPIMRKYTGARDRECNEIYQKDIIENPLLGKGVVEWSDENYCWVIKWRPKSIDSFETLLPVKIHLHKVIGNWFQNYRDL